MLGLIIRRAFWALFVLWVVMTGVFLLTNYIGDPASATLGPRAGPEALAAFRKTHGLDKPLGQRYLTYVDDVLHGNLGTSFRDGQPVTDVILERLPRTILLGVISLFIELTIGLVIGVIAAIKKGSYLDTGFMGAAFLGISLPTFVSGPLFLAWLAFRLGWFPVGGYGVGFWSHVGHAILPAFTLAIISSATYARIMRNEMIETMGSDYIRTARAKGLGPLRVILGHGVRTALLPIVTMMGLELAFLVSGALITEQIFAWPGMGRLAIESITSLDVPTVMGIVLVFCAVVQLGNLLADIAVAWLDPRVRLEQPDA